MRKVKAVCLMALLLGACTVGTDYQKPTAGVRPEWSTLQEDQKKSSKSVVRLANSEDKKDIIWWKQFSDKTLTELVEKSIANNYDIHIAEARLAEARAGQKSANAAFYPQINGVAGADRSKFNTPSGNVTDTSTQIGVGGTWEIDAFGGIKRRNEAADAEAEAAQADFEFVQLSLLAEVSTNYVRLRRLQKQYVIVSRNLRLQRSTLQITEDQRASGVISDMEVLRARAQVNNTAARLPEIKADTAEVVNRLSMLTALHVNDIKKMTDAVSPIPTIPKSVVVSTPIEALAQRPDVRIAERRLAKAAALSNAAFAEFFPKLSLEGFFGHETSHAYDSVSPWGVAVGGLVPLLNFGAISSQVDAANARQQQAYFGYKKTILLAVEETENALSNYINEIKRRETLAIAANEQVKATLLTREQFEAGVGTQLDLLVAEQSQLVAENDLVLSEAAVIENLIQLYYALGKQ